MTENITPHSSRLPGWPSFLDWPLPGSVETALIILLIALAALTRFYDLGARVMSHDEINHVALAYEFSQGGGYQYSPVTHGPLQFHLLALSYFLLGDNDFTSRLPAACFSVASVAFVLLAYRRYLGRLGALAAGLLLIISPYMLFYGRYARNEAFIIFWGLLTLYAILRYLESGERKMLFLFTLANALHFVDKATSYIYVALQMLFLALYLVYRLTEREWPRPHFRRGFLILLQLALLCGGAAGVLGLAAQPGAARSAGSAAAVVALAVAALAMAVAALVLLVRSLGLAGLRTERSFDLLWLLSSLLLSLLAALPLKLAGLDPLDYSPEGLLRGVIVFLVLLLLAAGLGLWWHPGEWHWHALLFYGLFVLFYTTVFTRPAGFGVGVMGALGYWLSQQAVSRGGQPWFYYIFLQIPLYEFLPALGCLLAGLLATRRRLWLSPGLSGNPVPTLPLLLYWAAMNLAAFTVAGEKMPWLVVNITLPMILASGWLLGWLLETLRLPRSPSGSLGFALRSAILLGLGFLAVLTARSAFRAAYRLYDYPFEYLVYAHAAPDPKRLLADIEQIGIRTGQGTGLAIAYDNEARYPYWWYLRHYPNQVDFSNQPTRSLRDAPLVFAGEETHARVDEYLGDEYVVYQATRMWWPNMDYWNLKWDFIDTDRRRDLGQDVPPMTIPEYCRYSWRRLRPFFTDPAVRHAVWQVWLNRDFGEYAGLKDSRSFTPENWSPAKKMWVYIRKDILAQAGELGISARSLAVSTLAGGAPITPLPVSQVFRTSSGEQQFVQLRDLVLAPDGSLYLADAGGHRIWHLDASGQVLKTWGFFADIAAGDALGGAFNEPWGLALGLDGSLYVADTWNHRIQKFTADGKFVTAWGYFGTGEAPEAFNAPRDLAVDAQGRMYVADTGNDRIVVFDAQGNYLTQFGRSGSASLPLDEPVGIAIDAAGRVYVADTGNRRVQVYGINPSGQGFAPLMAWQVRAWSGQAPENKPYISVDNRQHIWISDPQACLVMEFQSTGLSLHTWDLCGGETPLSPYGLAVQEAAGLWVAEAGEATLRYYALPAE